jgi:hypothetical protein
MTKVPHTKICCFLSLIFADLFWDGLVDEAMSGDRLADASRGFWTVLDQACHEQTVLHIPGVNPFAYQVSSTPPPIRLGRFLVCQDSCVWTVLFFHYTHF